MPATTVATTTHINTSYTVHKHFSLSARADQMVQITFELNVVYILHSNGYGIKLRLRMQESLVMLFVELLNDFQYNTGSEAEMRYNLISIYGHS